jgi:hypothetical protein
MRISNRLLACAAFIAATACGQALAAPCYADGSCRPLRVNGPDYQDRNFQDRGYGDSYSDAMQGAPDSPELHRPSTPEERAQTGRLNRQALAASEARNREGDAQFEYEMAQYQRDLRQYHAALQAYDQQMALYNRAFARGRHAARPVRPLPPRAPRGYEPGRDRYNDGRPGPYRGP